MKSVLASALAVGSALRPAHLVVADDAARRPGRSIDLFNGKDLTGWHTYLRGQGRGDPGGVFSVRKGLLRISGEVDGYLSTRSSWRDYRLVVEFRWGKTNRADRRGKARDSGLFLHSAGPDGNSYDARGAYKAAIECQIMEGAVGDILLIKGKDDKGKPIEPRIETRVAESRDPEGWPFYQPGGDRYQRSGWGRVNHRGKSRRWSDTFNFGNKGDGPRAWRRLECVCEGDRIEIIVDGRLVNVAERVYPASGPILLQSEGSEIFFRKIQLRPLR